MSQSKHAAAQHANDHRFSGGQVDAADPVLAESLLQIASILGCANIHCMASGLRLGYRMTKRLAQGQLRLLRSLGDAVSTSASHQQTLAIVVDEARGCL